MHKQKQKKMTFQLYKIHIPVIVKRHQWKILISVPNTQQANKTRVDKPLADNFKRESKYGITFLNNPQNILYGIFILNTG